VRGRSLRRLCACSVVAAAPARLASSAWARRHGTILRGGDRRCASTRGARNGVRPRTWHLRAYHSRSGVARSVLGMRACSAYRRICAGARCAFCAAGDGSTLEANVNSRSSAPSQCDLRFHEAGGRKLSSPNGAALSAVFWKCQCGVAWRAVRTSVFSSLMPWLPLPLLGRLANDDLLCCAPALVCATLLACGRKKGALVLPSSLFLYVLLSMPLLKPYVYLLCDVPSPEGRNLHLLGGNSGWAIHGILLCHLRLHSLLILNSACCILCGMPLHPVLVRRISASAKPLLLLPYLPVFSTFDGG